MKPLYFLLLGVFAACTSFAQKLEHFDVLLFDIGKSTDKLYAVSNPKFLTDYNPEGYNNQVRFFSPSDLYLVSQSPFDTTQTDIVALNLSSQTLTQVTQSAEAEYSPTPMPDGKSLSCIRVDADKTQRLWAYPLDRSDDGRVLLSKITGVGYHCWLSEELVALFIVGENSNPHTLVLADIQTQKTSKISSNPGRCLLKMADGRLAFVQKATEQTWFVKAYDPQKQSSDILFKTLPSSEDFAILSDGTFLMGNGPKLFQLNPKNSNTEWTEIADLSRFGVKKITRISVSSNNKVAIIVQ